MSAILDALRELWTAVLELLRSLEIHVTINNNRITDSA